MTRGRGRRRAPLAWGALLALAALAAAACTSDNPYYNGAGDGAPAEGGPAPGTPGGPCYPNDTCNAGLQCVNGRCVRRGDGGPADGGDAGGDLPRHDAPPTCPPVGFKSLVSRSSAAGDWTVLLEKGTSYKAISIAGAKPRQAAAVFDYDNNWEQVAGFVVSRPKTEPGVSAELAAAIAALSSADLGSVSTRTGGRAWTTHDGFPGVSGTTIDIAVSKPHQVSAVRLKVLAAVLGTPIKNLSGLPPAFGFPVTTFVVRLATVLRSDGRVVLMGAVDDKNSDDDPSKSVAQICKDAGSGTGLGRASAGLSQRCHGQTIKTQPLSKVDIIWVIDESGSMQTKRKDIAANAATFFAQAKNRGLDFRMGVTNVCSPQGPWKSAVGKFCSAASASPQHDGGKDRFLTPAEQATFAACINNPPGFEQGSEYGLVNAKEAVARHLPRASGDQSKIRQNAQLVLIVVTDEGPQSLKSVLSNNDFTKCTLSPGTQSKLDSAIKGYLDYFSGKPDADTALDQFQVIGGVCGSSGGSCSYTPQIAHGYKELAQALGGKVYDVCQKNLTPSITKIIDGILAKASPATLPQIPVAASVAVALDGVVLKRSPVGGFMHQPLTKSIYFTGGAKLKKGSVVVTSYRAWK